MGANQMSLRLLITLTAAPGKGAEFAQAFKTRCAEVMQEPGCEQFEVFQSAVNPDKLVLLELARLHRFISRSALLTATALAGLAQAQPGAPPRVAGPVISRAPGAVQGTPPAPSHTPSPIISRFPGGINKAPIVFGQPISPFAHPEEFTPPYELMIINNPSIQRTANFPASITAPLIVAHNPQIQFDFIVTANIPQYIGTGGLTNQYKTIGWLGDVATEACLTAGEAQLWPGAVNVGADASCPTEANATHDKFVDRAWFQVADASADLYVVQS